MRKVFLSIMILGKLEPTVYKSNDFELDSEAYYLPMSYIINNNVEQGDEITVITCVEQTKSGPGIAEKNYQVFVAEVEQIKEKYGLKVNYELVPMTERFDRMTFNYFFKKLAKKLRDGDNIYFDLTFGMKPYSISMFIAVAYAVKACQDACIACAFYSQKFSGSREAGSVTESRIYDLTGLMFLNDFAASVTAGDKELADNMLDSMLPEEETED